MAEETPKKRGRPRKQPVEREILQALHISATG